MKKQTKFRRGIAFSKLEVAGYPALKLGLSEKKQVLVRIALVLALTSFLLAQLSLPSIQFKTQTNLDQTSGKAASKSNPIETLSLRTEGSKTYDLGGQKTVSSSKRNRSRRAKKA